MDPFNMTDHCHALFIISQNMSFFYTMSSMCAVYYFMRSIIYLTHYIYDLHSTIYGYNGCSLLYSTLLYSTLLYSTLLYSTLLYSTLLYSTLLYSTLL